MSVSLSDLDYPTISYDYWNCSPGKDYTCRYLTMHGSILKNEDDLKIS